MHTHPLNQKVADPGGRGEGGRVPPYMGFMGRPKGSNGFQAVYSGIGYINQRVLV